MLVESEYSLKPKFFSGGSKGGMRDARPPVQILSISCSFWEILAKSYVGANFGELAPPPQGNPILLVKLRDNNKVSNNKCNW